MSARTGPADPPPVLPGRLEIHGCGVSVRRAWPKPDGTQTFEGVDDAGRLRAGRWDGQTASLLPHAADPGLPALAGEGSLLVHRYGRRAVLRRNGERGPEYVKVLRPGKAAAVAVVSRRLAEAAAAAGLHVPEVLAEGDGVVRFSEVPGQALGGLPPEAWHRAWAAWAVAWPRLASTDASGLPVHNVASELGVLRTWAGHLAQHDPLRLSLAAKVELDARLGRASAALEAAGPGRQSLAHRDLHDKQMLFDPKTRRLGILDFDTAARADVELDLGNLLAHVDLRRDQGVIDDRARRTAVEAVAAAAEALGAGQDRLDAYTEAARIRLGCVYAFRPPWRGLAADWLAGGPPRGGP